MGGKISTKKREKTIVKKDEFSDLDFNFSKPSQKNSKSKNDDFDFGFADFGKSKKNSKKDDFDFTFNKKKDKGNGEMRSRLNRNKSQNKNQKNNKNQEELLKFQGKSRKEDENLLDFGVPANNKGKGTSTNDDFDFL